MPYKRLVIHLDVVLTYALGIERCFANSLYCSCFWLFSFRPLPVSILSGILKQPEKRVTHSGSAKTRARSCNSATSLRTFLDLYLTMPRTIFMARDWKRSIST